ncbi:MAG: heme lyase CcmF/NrfE family subunit [Luminiphilus sp.]|nr:heme lyase CcmF/NrfE family subunit [Luminiphilus sp.]
MIPELGHVALIIAFMLASGLAVLPMWGSARRDVAMMNLAPTLAVGVMLFVALAFAFLATSFLQDDFTVAVVAANSNSLLPPIFKFSALWGNHEGSLLLWVLILSGWMTAVAFFSRGLPLVMVARVLSVMGMIAVGFLAFSLLTSNPFERLLPTTPLDGNDLNPLLQDPGLIIHPPLLYMGYVGLSVPFAFAIAALIGGRLDASWARWSRPWTNVAWGFLSLGIMLGSWWAYYELGWGGWWFWDPVENASFMPWLMGTALVHSLAVTEKRGVFRSWTVLLAIFAFSLSLLGTFLVRSGVLTSVHAFASDPERGLFILIFLALVVGASLLLYALRAPAVASRVSYGPVSRESLLMINNLVFTVAATVVLLGTLFPLVMDAFSLGKYSVGPPYFNAVFVPLMALVTPFMTVAPLSRWREDSAARWLHELVVPAIGVGVIAAASSFMGQQGFNIWIGLAVLLAGWVSLGVVKDFLRRVKGKGQGPFRWRALSPSFIGMSLAHLGFAAVVLGAVVVTQENQERDLRMAVGDSEELGGYRFELKRLGQLAGPNYVAEQAVFEVSRAGELLAVLVPEKRRYLASGQVMTEAAIDASLWRDLYIALGEPIGEGAWAVRLQYKPLVRWLWLGALMIGLGAIVTVFDRRYRAQAQTRSMIEHGVVGLAS